VVASSSVPTSSIEAPQQAGRSHRRKLQRKPALKEEDYAKAPLHRDIQAVVQRHEKTNALFLTRHAPRQQKKKHDDQPPQQYVNKHVHRQKHQNHSTTSSAETTRNKSEKTKLVRQLESSPQLQTQGQRLRDNSPL
jgi:hypothetical protein